MSEWQPIETVPKVGTFLVYLPEEFLRPFQVMYRTERTTIIGGAFAFDMSKPTHWQPLPAPPVESKSEVGDDMTARAKNCTYGNPDCPRCNPA